MGRDRNAFVIGAGFAGLSAAAVLARRGFNTSLLEKHDQPGGRARVFKSDGFTFDMGPSWYWMPEVMESFFRRFGHSAADFFTLKRLDPSYQIIYSNDNVFTVPAAYEDLREAFEEREAGAGAKLDKFLKEARFKYEIGIHDFVNKPGLSWREFIHWPAIKASFRLNLFQSFAAHIRKYFRSPELLQLLEFPVLFLGAMPGKIPALYSMMNYADMMLGTWYPMGGFGKLAEAFETIARKNGVTFHYNTEVKAIAVDGGRAKKLITSQGDFHADLVLGSADYHHIEQHLLPEKYRQYTNHYWHKRTMAPSCLIFYIGVRKKLPRLLHHNLFFERSFNDHAQSIYVKPDWPENPLYYVCCPSKTDDTVAPRGMENLFVLIPVAPGLPDNEEIRDRYYHETIRRLEDFCGSPFSDDIAFHKTYAHSDFVNDYHAFKGNAYGLANTLSQTAILKPSIASRKVGNLFYAGQLTVPGPGVPPAIISGQLVANYISSNVKIRSL